MYGRWHRLTAAQLEDAKKDLGWALDLVEAESEAEEESGEDHRLADLRSFGTDKAWHALDYLLDRIGFPYGIVFGQHQMIDDYDPDTADPDADWGYGPPGFLTPQEVREAAEALASMTAEDLLRGLDPAELTREGIYPAIWDDPNELEWITGYLPDIRVWFGAAAAAGDAMLCWIA
jgi:hypothetical protein